MELNRKAELLLKYENGETSLSEERELKKIIVAECSTENDTLKSVFNFYEVEKREVLNKEIRIESKSSFKDKWFALAASLVLVFGLTFVLIQNREEVKPDSAVMQNSDNPEMMLKETQKALAMLSENVNSGIGSMHYLKEFEKSKGKIFRD